jgi:hypothetical protein
MGGHEDRAVTLLLRPVGRGNWRVITMVVTGAGDLFTLRPGHRLQVQGFPLLRIVEVRP